MCSLARIEGRLLAGLPDVILSVFFPEPHGLTGRQPHKSRLAKILLNLTFIRATARSALRAHRSECDLWCNLRAASVHNSVPSAPSAIIRRPEFSGGCRKP
jgi:hypothetical protein